MTPIDPTSSGFLFAESRAQPMHVGGLQLFSKPEGAGRNFVKDLYEEMLGYEEPSSLFLKRPHRSLTTGGQWFWKEDDQFDLEYHFRHSALPKPGRIRELLELCGRLHSTRLALERPLWEVHLIEGLRDGRVAMYSKMHHALVDGISSMRLVQHVLSKDPDETGMPPMWSADHSSKPSSSGEEGTDPGIFGLSANVRALAHSRSARTRQGCPRRSGEDADSLASATRRPRCRSTPPARSSTRRSPAPAASPPRTGRWSASRRSARHRARRVNDVVLAMCSGAMRTYFTELDALPDASLVAMVPVGLQAKQSQSASASGGNAVGAVMVKLGTDQADPADRLEVIHRSMVDGKEALGTHDPGPDPRDERARPGPRDPRADAEDAGPHPAAVQPDHLQRARAPRSRTTSTAPGSRASTRCRSRSTAWG